MNTPDSQALTETTVELKIPTKAERRKLEAAKSELQAAVKEGKEKRDTAYINSTVLNTRNALVAVMLEVYGEEGIDECKEYDDLISDASGLLDSAKPKVTSAKKMPRFRYAKTGETTSGREVSTRSH